MWALYYLSRDSTFLDFVVSTFFAHYDETKMQRWHLHKQMLMVLSQYNSNDLIKSPCLRF